MTSPMASPADIPLLSLTKYKEAGRLFDVEEDSTIFRAPPVEHLLSTVSSSGKKRNRIELAGFALGAERSVCCLAKKYFHKLTSERGEEIYISKRSFIGRTGLPLKTLEDCESIKHLKDKLKDLQSRMGFFNKDRSLSYQQLRVLLQLREISEKNQRNFRVGKNRILPFSVDFVGGIIYKNLINSPKKLGNYKKAKLCTTLSGDRYMKIIALEGENERLEKEYKAIQSVAGKGVVSAFSFFKYCSKERKEKVAFFMPEYEQGDLLGILENKEHLITPKFRLKIVHQLLIGLSRIHKKGIHFDIKPDNIFVDAYGNVYIGDFGFYVAFKDQKREELYSRGSPHWVSPEGFRGRFTTKRDIWSLGLVFAALWGAFPSFWGEEDSENLNDILTQLQSLCNGWQDGLKPTHHMPSKIWSMIERMLDVDYRQRPSAEELLKEFNEEFNEEYGDRFEKEFSMSLKYTIEASSRILSV